MERKIVLPGDKVAEGRITAPNTYSDNNATYAAVVGMVDDEGRYIPLENRYRPSVGDVVVGMVTDVRHAGYEVDLNLPQGGFIPTRDVRLTLQLGDFVICKIKLVNEVGDVDLGEVRRLPKGKIIEFPSAKVPRLIGKKSSMITLLKDYAGGDIMVGNNGYVWMSDRSDIPLLLKAIAIIEKKAHKSGLTDEIGNFLRSQVGDMVVQNREDGEEKGQEIESGSGYEGDEYGKQY
jgi:exosome complex component RRP4